MKTKTMKITGLLLTLVMLVIMLGLFGITAFAADATACAHTTYINGVCTACGEACAHSFGDSGVCTACGEVLVISVTTAEGNTTYYSELVYALNAVEKSTEANTTFKLLKPITGWFYVSRGTFTLDLNGQTFTGSDVLYPTLTISGGSVTITDSQGGGKIIDAPGSGNAAVAVEDGSLTIAGGTLEGYNGLQVIDSTVTLAGGSVIGSAADISFWFNGTTPSLTIEGAPADGSYTFSLGEPNDTPTYIPNASGEYLKIASATGTANASWFRYADTGNDHLTVVTGDKVTLTDGSKGSAGDLYVVYCGHETVSESNGVTSCSACGTVFVAYVTPSNTYFADLNVALDYQKTQYTDKSQKSEVKLLADVNQAVCLTGSANATSYPQLDLNGHTITVSTGDAVTIIFGSCFGVQNGTIKSESGNGIKLETQATLRLLNTNGWLKIESGSGKADICLANYAQVIDNTAAIEGSQTYTVGLENWPPMWANDNTIGSGANNAADFTASDSNYTIYADGDGSVLQLRHKLKRPNIYLGETYVSEDDSGNIWTATCNGSAAQVMFRGYFNGEDFLSEGTHYVLAWCDSAGAAMASAPKDAGTYTFTFTGKENTDYAGVTYTGTLVIAPGHEHNWTYSNTDGDNTITATCIGDGTCTVGDGTATITLSDPDASDTLIYNGNAVEITVTQSPAGTFDDLPITYKQGETTLDAALTNAGSYTAGITVGEGDAAVTASVEYTVTAVSLAGAEITVASGITYTGSAITPDVTVKLGEKSLTAADYDVVYTNNKNVGTATVTIAGKGNYKDSASTTFTIVKAAAPEIQWPTASSLVYGQTLSASALTSEDKNGTFAWQDGNTVPPVTNNGYVVVYTPKDTVNYDYTGVELTKAITAAVSKKTVTITVDNKSICVEKVQPALTYTVSGLIDGDALITNPTLTTNAVMTTAGDYTITASGADAGNNYTVTYQNGTLTVKNHTPGDAATHTSAQICTVCGHELQAALGHNYSTEWKSDGTNHWHECSCGAKKDTTAHTFTETVKDEAKKSDADCLNAAVYYKSCSVCGFVGNDTFTSGEANGHSFTDYDSDNNATCTTNATETAKCDHCDVTDTRTVADSAIGHSFTNYVSDENATCTADGTKTAQCDDCEETDTQIDTDSKLAHTFEKGECTACGTEDPEYTNLTWLWIMLPVVIVLGGGGFALYWFVIRKKKEQS